MWLLSESELSRVRWRNGDKEGELIVEINSVEETPMMNRSVTVTTDSASETEYTLKNPERAYSPPRLYVTVYDQHDDLMANRP
ncbi:hypothetical protein NLI96_g11649 [Meripilus lineatus]|uniref:Uncharacterized protein n=1 Tax=Meripilus lineatus TaxID=2056292 RepID=A0AAD5URE7_9APHY|nr:hypothetical protein NLI96_g11649 [Physisporinus lineatus]